MSFNTEVILARDSTLKVIISHSPVARARVGTISLNFENTTHNSSVIPWRIKHWNGTRPSYRCLHIIERNEIGTSCCRRNRCATGSIQRTRLGRRNIHLGSGRALLARLNLWRLEMAEDSDHPLLIQRTGDGILAVIITSLTLNIVIALTILVKLENNILLCDLGLIIGVSGDVKRTSIPPRQRKHSRITTALMLILKLVAFSPGIVRISENLIKTHRPHSFNSMNDSIVQTKISRCMPNQLPTKANHSSRMQLIGRRKFLRCLRRFHRISQLAFLIFLFLLLKCGRDGK
mmetsp:Transcript_20552/g.33865  ORF Transcript_20552/g.33865 Transcript_20552/m.33865 type:complete len:290 (-) Transcript_20552:176-1045(-)